MADPLSALWNELEGAVGAAAGAVQGTVVIKSNILPDINIAPSGSDGSSSWAGVLGSLVKPAVYVGALGQQEEVAAPFGEPTEGLWIAALIGFFLLWLFSLALAMAVLR